MFRYFFLLGWLDMTQVDKRLCLNRQLLLFQLALPLLCLHLFFPSSDGTPAKTAVENNSDDKSVVRNLITFIVSDFKILFACKTISNIFQMQIIARKAFHII